MVKVKATVLLRLLNPWRLEPVREFEVEEEDLERLKELIERIQFPEDEKV